MYEVKVNECEVKANQCVRSVLVCEVKKVNQGMRSRLISVRSCLAERREVSAILSLGLACSVSPWAWRVGVAGLLTSLPGPTFHITRSNICMTASKVRLACLSFGLVGVWSCAQS